MAFAAHRVTVVVSSGANPKQVSGAHARAHANEEALYRQVAEDTFTSFRVPVTTFVADTLRQEATNRLPDAAMIDATIKRFWTVSLLCYGDQREAEGAGDWDSVASSIAVATASPPSRCSRRHGYFRARRAP